MTVTINQEQIVFYYELGVAITQWAHVERQLCEIATYCFARQPDEFSLEEYADHYSAFFSIENFRSKIAYADSVFQRRYGNTEHTADWKLIVVSMHKRARIRNFFAHSPTIGIPHAPEGRRFCIAPRQIGQTQSPIYPDGAFFLEDVVRHRLRFGALHARLRRFYERLRGFEPLLEASAEQPREPPPLQQIVEQILSVLGRPQPPSEA